MSLSVSLPESIRLKMNDMSINMSMCLIVNPSEDISMTV